MCLAIPARVVQVHADESATIDLGGVRKSVSLALVDGVREGDYVIVHVGYALTKLDPVEAAKTLALFAQTGVMETTAITTETTETTEKRNATFSYLAVSVVPMVDTMS